MAGMQFEIDVEQSEREFFQSILRLSQRRAKISGLELRYRWRASGAYSVTVDGPLPTLQAFFEPLMIAVLSHAEGMAGYQNPANRVAAARRITKAYAEQLDELSDFVGQVSKTLGGVPNSYDFDTGEATHLTGRLSEFRIALTLYHQGRLSPNQLAEECHTSLELLMKSVLGRKAKKLSFGGMVNKVGEQGLISSDLVDDLIELKNIRRDAKHKGKGVTEDTIEGLLPSVLRASHELCAAL